MAAATTSQEPIFYAPQPLNEENMSYHLSRVGDAPVKVSCPECKNIVITETSPKVGRLTLYTSLIMLTNPW